MCRVGLRWFCAGVVAIVSLHGRAECTGPTYEALKPPPYPVAAIVAHAEGRVLVHLWIDASGKVVKVAPGESSGNVDLDQAAIESVPSWRYAPRVCDGKAVASEAIVPVKFDLGSAGLPPQIEEDETPSPLIDATALLRFLHENEAVKKDASRSLDAATILTHFSMPSEHVTFRVVESTDLESGAIFISILRERFVIRDKTTAVLYSHICSGSAEWCERLKDAQVTLLKNPPQRMPVP